jgi:hypothetical protein
MSLSPTVGRIVHYQAHGSPDGTHTPAARAAIITEVFNDACVSLCVLNPNGMYFSTSVMIDESTEPKGGTWRWPPRA